MIILGRSWPGTEDAAAELPPRSRPCRKAGACPATPPRRTSSSATPSSSSAGTERINLTGARSAGAVVAEHYPDAFALARRLDGPARLVDVGSGGGLPALPLALLRPGADRSALRADRQEGGLPANRRPRARARRTGSRLSHAGARRSPQRVLGSTLRSRGQPSSRRPGWPSAGGWSSPAGVSSSSPSLNRRSPGGARSTPGGAGPSSRSRSKGREAIRWRPVFHVEHRPEGAGPTVPRGTSRQSTPPRQSIPSDWWPRGS